MLQQRTPKRTFRDFGSARGERETRENTEPIQPRLLSAVVARSYNLARMDTTEYLNTVRVFPLHRPSWKHGSSLYKPQEQGRVGLYVQ